MTNRRQFLKAAASTVMSAPLLNLSAYGASGSDYKALVCIFLYGGLDTHDMLIGHDDAGYRNWASARENLVENYAAGSLSSREQSRLLPIDPANAADFGDRRFALPPEMQALADLFGQGRAAIVPNVGPLMEPTTRTQVKNRTANLPKRVGSHNDQQSTWQSLGTEGTTIGWGGRLLDLTGGGGSYGAISVGSKAVLLNGKSTLPVEITSKSGIETLYEIDENRYGAPGLSQRMERWFKTAGSSAGSSMARDYQGLQSRAIDDTRLFDSILFEQTLGDSVMIDGNPLSDQLGTIANLIAAQSALGARRQVFFTGIGGFDTHADQTEKLPVLLKMISDAVGSFQRALDGSGLSERVTTFTASDFGRTLVSNSSGTDHGWGSHHLVIGGAVDGRKIVGEVPPFEENHEQDFRRGALIPQISVEQYGSEFGRWFGLGERELDLVFPNRGRFDRSPLGIFRP
jgi:uncharacterized protein (DUF1501 family)